MKGFIAISLVYILALQTNLQTNFALLCQLLIYSHGTIESRDLRIMT